MVRRTNKELRTRILASFTDKPMPIREIAKKAKVDWYSTERHLTYLKGRDMVKEVFSHRLLRLFHITELGKQVVEELNKKHSTKKIPYDKKTILRLIKRSI